MTDKRTRPVNLPTTQDHGKEYAVTAMCQADWWDHAEPLITADGFTRNRRQDHSAGLDLIRDSFAGSDACCYFLRYRIKITHPLKLRLDGSYAVRTLPGNGWMLEPRESGVAAYWIPQPPQVRRLDADGHILAHGAAEILALDAAASTLSITLQAPADQALDLVFWQLPPDSLAAEIEQLSNLERQAYFLWSSHTRYQDPADLYLHLVHGHVYENHEVWPRYWRVCSELDAFALYVILSGLHRATSKKLYAILKQQVVCSVIARQAIDGGWYHGEWTDGMESHYRLHAGAIHLLAAAVEEGDDPVVRSALDKAVAFAADNTDQIDPGAWFLHDSLEKEHRVQALYPFGTASNRVLGKSPDNMLVLNTHLDTAIALERHRCATGEQTHAKLIASAQAAKQAVLRLRPAEWLYRLLFWVVRLTFLGESRARALPLPLRALKRIGWKYLIPRLHQIKSRFPRFIMPGGFIDRSVAQAGCATRYLPVNIWDLLRWQKAFGDAEPAVRKALDYTQHGGIRQRWKEKKAKEDDALGFWAEALYLLCLLDPDPGARPWLAEAVLDLEQNGLGLPPSLLGANPELIGPAEQRPCPAPADHRLRVINLSRGENAELLVINPAAEPIALDWQQAPEREISWQRADGCAAGDVPVPPRDWLWGKG